MNEITYLHLLRPETMLSNSHAWLNNNDIVLAVESHVLGLGMFGEIRTAHEGLSEALDGKLQLAARLMALTQTIALVDGEHDSCLRALYNLFTGLAEAETDPGRAARWLAVRDLLFPQGLAQTQHSYAQEHGAVVKSEERMTPEVQELLEQTTIGSGTLWALYLRWVAAGKQLGELVKERSRVEESMLLRNGGAPVHVREARKTWLRVVRVFIGAAELLNLEPNVERAIFAPLRRDVADAVAAFRARGQDIDGEYDDDLPTGDDGALPDDMPAAGDEPIGQAQ